MKQFIKLSFFLTVLINCMGCHSWKSAENEKVTLASDQRLPRDLRIKIFMLFINKAIHLDEVLVINDDDEVIEYMRKKYKNKIFESFRSFEFNVDKSDRYIISKKNIFCRVFEIVDVEKNINRTNGAMRQYIGPYYVMLSNFNVKRSIWNDNFIVSFLE